MAAACFLINRQQTSSENMSTIIFTDYFVQRTQHEFSPFETQVTQQLISWHRGWDFHIFIQVSFWNSPFLCFNWISTTILRIDWRGNIECLFVCRPNAYTYISFGNRSSCCWLRGKQFNLHFSLSDCPITPLYVLSWKSQEIVEIRTSYCLNRQVIKSVNYVRY